MSGERMVTVVIGSGHGSDRQKAEVSVIGGKAIWLTFLGPRGGRQYTVPVSRSGASDLGRALSQAAFAVPREDTRRG